MSQFAVISGLGYGCHHVTSYHLMLVTSEIGFLAFQKVVTEEAFWVKHAGLEEIYLYLLGMLSMLALLRNSLP